MALSVTNPLGAILLAVGSILGGKAPDYLEIPYWGSRRLIPHRTITHWTLGWCVIAIFAATQASHPAAWMLLGFAIGCLIHISGDSITPMGVPRLHPYKRTRGPRWAKSGGGWYEFNWILMVWTTSAIAAFGIYKLTP